MWDTTTVESMHTDVFCHLFWQSLSLSKWARPLSMGPRVKAVHREFPKRGGELLFNSLQVVISAAGEATLIFSVWQISNIMHCQIILNTLSVTRRPCSQYSDLLWLINSTATACHWTINQDTPPTPPHYHTYPPPNKPAHPLTLLHLSAYLNMRWRLAGFHKISLWENTRRGKAVYTCRNFDRAKCTALLCQWTWQPLSPQSEVFSRFIYTLYWSPCGVGGFFSKISLSACLSCWRSLFEQAFTKFLGKQGGREWKVWQCLPPVWW